MMCKSQKNFIFNKIRNKRNGPEYEYIFRYGLFGYRQTLKTFKGSEKYEKKENK